MSALNPALEGKSPLGFVTFELYGRPVSRTPFYQGEDPQGNLLLARAKAAVVALTFPMVPGAVTPSMLDRADRVVSLAKGARFLSQEWRRVTERRLSDSDPELYRYVRASVRDIQVAYTRLMRLTNGYPVGLECRNPDYELCPQWAAVLPNGSGKAPWRVQCFDRFAFSSYETYATLDAAAEAMIRQGFTSPDPDALNRVSSGEDWKKGLAWSEEFRAASLKRA